MKKIILSIAFLLGILVTTNCFSYEEPGKASAVGDDLYCTYIGTCFSDNNPFTTEFESGGLYEIHFDGGRVWARVWSAEDSDPGSGDSHFRFEPRDGDASGNEFDVIFE